jgi:RNA polymerase sigma-70 factor (ECF subfamily)
MVRRSNHRSASSTYHLPLIPIFHFPCNLLRILRQLNESALTGDEDIIQGCIKGDRRAQQELFRKHAPRMFGVCLRYCDSREDAEDLLHDGFVKLFSVIGSFKKESSLETWMTRVFVNEAISRIRRKKSRGEWLSLNEDTDIAEEESVPDTEPDYLVDEVLAAIQMLPDKYRIILNLYAIEKRSHREISELTGMTEGASKSQLSRARVLLRNLMNNNKKPD